MWRQFVLSRPPPNHFHGRPLSPSSSFPSCICLSLPFLILSLLHLSLSSLQATGALLTTVASCILFPANLIASTQAAKRWRRGRERVKRDGWEERVLMQGERPGCVTRERGREGGMGWGGLECAWKKNARAYICQWRCDLTLQMGGCSCMYSFAVTETPTRAHTHTHIRTHKHTHTHRYKPRRWRAC